MTEDEPTPPDRRDVSDDKERSRILEEVLRDQARREVLRDVIYRRPSASLGTRIAAVVLALAAFALWALPLPGLRPHIPFPIAAEDEEEGLRLATFVQAQQVEAFRQSAGRLPDVLRETGEPLPGIDYERLDAHTYRLSGATERTRISWLSSDSIPALLGDSGMARLRQISR